MNDDGNGKLQENLRRAIDQLAVFRSFTEASDQGLGIADLKGSITYANPALCRIMGEERPEDVIGNNFFQYMGSQSPQLMKEYVSIMLRDGGRTTEGNLRTRQGTLVPVSACDFLLRDELGNPAFFATILTDISERKRAEQSLRQSELQYRTLVEMAPDAVILSDLTGRVTFASRRLAEFWGDGTADDFRGKTAFDFMVPEDHPRFAANLQQTLKDGVTRSVEYSFFRKDGTRFPAEVSATIVKDLAGIPTSAIVILRDLSERKRVEQALRQTNDELRAIYHSVVDGIMIVDMASVQVVRVNAAFCLMLGYSEDESLHLTQEQVYSPEWLPTIRELTSAVKNGATERLDAVPHIRKDGTVVYVDVILGPMLYNNRPAMIGFLHDVTERKKTQMTLEREHRTLRHLLQSSDHERQLIAYEIHDGLAQYLAGAIMQFQTSRYLKDSNAQDAAKAHDGGMLLLQQAHSEARRLISGVRPPILDESGVVAAVGHLVNEERHQNGPIIEFHTEVAFDRLVPIQENAIYRIIQEGLTNACKYSRSPRIRLELSQEEDILRIKIQDWGIGFSPDLVEENSFGLAGVRERARLLGGIAAIESAPGQGTCITVELPLVLRA